MVFYGLRLIDECARARVCVYTYVQSTPTSSTYLHICSRKIRVKYRVLSFTWRQYVLSVHIIT